MAKKRKTKVEEITINTSEPNQEPETEIKSEPEIKHEPKPASCGAASAQPYKRPLRRL